MTERASGEPAFGGHHGGGIAAMTPEQRHEAALKRVQTMKAKGEKVGWARLTPEQIHERAIKSAATRKREGISGFGHMSAAQRVEAAKKATATRRARHER